MNKRRHPAFIIIFYLAVFLFELFMPCPSACTQRAVQSGSCYTGIYQNLFTELLGENERIVKEKVGHAFRQLFLGDDTTQRIYYPVEPDMAYIKDINNDDVRTEGMSYGMMIAVQLDEKEVFDRLWKWAKTFMQHQEEPRKYYFAWHCRADGTRIDLNSASDGEEWFVTALFFASARWGNGDGIFNYRAEAQSILNAMLSKAESSDRRDVVTNMFNKKEHQVVFVPSGTADDFTDPSYHLPHFYELWARWSDNQNDFWAKAAETSREFLKKAVHPVTGLAPDYAGFDGSPVDSPWGGGHDRFQFDAWRVAMNIAVDYQWFARDKWPVFQSNRLLGFFHSQGMGKYGNLYTLDGKNFSRDHSAGLVAMNAVAALASDLEYRKEFIEELWNLSVPGGKYRYYDGILYMLALLQVSGNFKIYEPAALEPDETSAKDPVLSVTEKNQDGYFCLSGPGKSAPLCISGQDFPGVIRISGLFQSDIEKVTGWKPQVYTDMIPEVREIVLIGTLGRNPYIDRLITNQKLDVSGIQGKRETYLIQVLENPMPDIDRALVIAGSDKRGTLYGMFDLSRKIGVSPWTWWADVPVKKKSSIYISPDRYTTGEPKVKYRGIFINDEAPALSGWAEDKFGTAMFNHQLYEHVFELILRLKGNFLWPAMWGRAFYDDDPLNPQLADEYGIVIGTSHHEPMMRAHDEWRRYGSGPWNYEKNENALREFWKEGIKRMGSNESIVTLAMRGDGDEAMSPTANISLLQRIVLDQRKILAEVTGRDVTAIPQVWALYKEVQDYYDKGMRVPDDVTLLLCDDNWGNLRKLPKLSDKHRKGGYGIYYHFDYVGGPRNYKWLNTNQIERVWEQMHLAYEHGVREIWIVNVGDIKPMEFPISFFLDYAWNPDLISTGLLPEYYKTWAREQFGEEHPDEIAEILSKYTQYNSRRKPELLSPDTYSLINYREAETVVNDYNELHKRARIISDSIAREYKDSFYQLVLHPVEACSNLNELYATTAMNRLYANQKRSLTNTLAEKVEALFRKDAQITAYYNQVMSGGKWNHMMDQTHIGYTYWQQPDYNAIPEVKRIDPSEKAEMGVAVEGSGSSWPGGDHEAVLPGFDPFNKQTYYIEVFNRGKIPFDYSVRTGKPWVKVSPSSGNLETEKRLWVSIDWEKVPAGSHKIPITVSGPDKARVAVQALIHNPLIPAEDLENRFMESNHYISIEAVNFTNSVESSPVSWLEIPELGRTGSAVTLMPVTAETLNPGEAGSRLEYHVYFFSTGEVKVNFYLSPTLNYKYTEGLRFAVSFDDEDPQMINMHEGDTPDWQYPGYWNQAVSDNIRIAASKHRIGESGMHVLKYWAVDPGIVLQKIVIETGDVKTSYLGPPQSYNGFLLK